MKKTFKVENFKNIINEKLALTSINQDEKKALTVVLERVLHDTNNYRGFNYLQWLNGGSEKWQANKDIIDYFMLDKLGKVLYNHCPLVTLIGYT